MSVEITRDGAVLTARITRPEALNAINDEVMTGLEATLDQLRADQSLRALILTGAGERAFISGGDLKAFADLRTADEGRVMAARMGAILDAFEALDCWVIAAINGDAYGGGCETLLACDVRIATTTATLGFTQGRFALPPGWGGLTRLVERVGRGLALSWLGTRALVPAPEAHRVGLLEHLSPPDTFAPDTAALAASLSKTPRDLIATLKQGALRATATPRPDAIAAELEPFARHWASEAHHARVEAFLGRTTS